MIPDICKYPWKFAVKPFRIAGSLYYVGNRTVSSHLIDTGDGLILIDTTFPQTVYLLLESIRVLGFDPREIKYILHSHAHYDHCGGTKAVSALTGAKTYLGRDDIFILNERQDLLWAEEYGVEFTETFHVDVPVSGGDIISLGNTAIECIATPGHTPGAMSYFFDVVEAGRKYTAGMHGGPGLNSLTDEYLSKHNMPGKNRELYLNALGVLKAKHVDIFIGIHPVQNKILEKSVKITGKENPLIDPGIWDSYIQNLEKRARKAWQGSMQRL